MAEKRMFTQKIIDSDAFLDMPLSTQALYFHLNMQADDDGFINNAKRIQRTIGASDDDLNRLLKNRFILSFENGVMVIKHWRMHNTLKKDRYNPTQYQEQLALLDVKPNKAYTEKELSPPGTKTEPKRNQNGTKTEPQFSIGKYSLDKISIGECLNEELSAPTQKLYGEYKNVILSNQELDKLKAEYPDYLEKIERLSSYVASSGKEYKSHYATIKRWAKEDKAKQQQNKTKNGFHNFQQRDYNYDELEKELMKKNREKE